MQNFKGGEGANKVHSGKCGSGVWTLNLNWSDKRVTQIKELIQLI